MIDMEVQATAIVLALGVAAGALNAIAGGGPIIVVAALVALGWRADIASLTSTVALLPGQMLAGWQGRAGLVQCGPPALRRTLVGIALLGGATGALLLLFIPARLFAHLLPWLVLFATGLYAWSSSAQVGDRHEEEAARSPNRGLLALLSVYGGFYGGGNSFLVLALLTHARISPRVAAQAKNILVMLMNAAAAAVFLASGEVAWEMAAPLGSGALLGSFAGVLLIDRLSSRAMRWLVIGCGLTLGIGMVLRG